MVEASSTMLKMPFVYTFSLAIVAARHVCRVLSKPTYSILDTRYHFERHVTVVIVKRDRMRYCMDLIMTRDLNTVVDYLQTSNNPLWELCPYLKTDNVVAHKCTPL